MTVRVEVVTPCEVCGSYAEDSRKHQYVPAGEIIEAWCEGSGGSRRSFTEWPPEAIEAAARAWFNIEAGIEDLEFGEELRWSEIDEIVRDDYRHKAEDALAAAWGHITGDNK